MTTRHAHPAATFFGTLISRSFSLFRQSVHFFVYRFNIQLFYRFAYSFTFGFHFEFSFVETVPAISGRLEQHTLAPKFKAEVALRL
jgi:hypothetical protein